MRTAPLVASLAALLSLSACPRRDPPATAPAPDASPRPPAAPAPLRTLDPSPSVSDDTGSERPAVAVDARGTVYVAWYEAGSVLLKRWNGRAWDPLGGAPNEGVAGGPFALVLSSDGAPVMVWAQRGPARADEVRAARFDGQRWSPLGGALVPPATGFAVTHVTATVSGPSLTVAFATRRGEDAGGLRAMRWSGSYWEGVGGASLSANGAAPRALASTACADGSIVLAWVESGPSVSPALQLRRWDPQGNRWDEIPRGNAPSVDAETRTLALAPATDDEFFLAYGWSVGMHTVVRWNAATRGWTELGVPQDALRRSAIVSGPALASREGELLYAWRARGGRLSAARFDGRAWHALDVALDTPSSSDGAIAFAPEGRLYTAFIDRAPRRQRVTVAAIERAR